MPDRSRKAPSNLELHQAYFIGISLMKQKQDRIKCGALKNTRTLDPFRVTQFSINVHFKGSFTESRWIFSVIVLIIKNLDINIEKFGPVVFLEFFFNI